MRTSPRQLIVGVNDLMTLHPEVAVMADGWDASTVTPGSGLKKSWKCPLGHSYESDVWVVVHAARFRGCPYCARQRVLTGFSDLATTHPDLAAEAFGWDPTIVMRNHNKHKQWKCSQCQEIWVVSPNNRKGCPYCAGNKVRTGVTDLATMFPEIAAQADGWDTTKVSSCSGLIKKWVCSEGHSWSCAVGNRTNLGSGCPKCNGHGYVSYLDGYLYLISHKKRMRQKIGVSNVVEKRLNTHKINGWDIVEIFGPLNGVEAYEHEQKIIGALRSRGVIFHDPTVDKKFDGYTESWPTDRLEARSIQQLIDMT